MHKKHMFVATGLGIGLLVIGGLLLNAQGSSTLEASKPIGVWSWDAPGSVTIDQVKSQASKLKETGVSNVFIDVTSYLDVMELPADQNPQEAIANFTNSLKETARAYSLAGLQPFALAGSSKWGTPDLQYLPLAIVDYVKDYNTQATPEEKLQGIQFDIEPYSQEGFYDDAVAGFKDYLIVTKAIIERHASNFSQDTSLGFAVPFWFDGENPDVPQVTTNDSAKFPIFHLIDQLLSVPNGYIAVMAYRNQTSGDNGSIKLSKNEADYASKTQSVKVYIGQETTNVDPPSITFYSLGLNKLKSAIKELDTTLSGQQSYGGIIVHDAKGLLELKAK